MKKIFFVLWLSVFSCLYPRPVQNPASPSLLEKGIFFPDTQRASFRVDGGFNEMWNLNLKVLKKSQAHLTKNSGREFFVDGICNVNEQIDFVALFGFGNYRFRGENFSKHFFAEIHSAPFLQVGAKLYLWEIKNFSFYGGGQASWILKKRGETKEKTPCRYEQRDWQVFFSVSTLIKYVEPYIGVCIYNAKSKLCFSTNSMHMESSERVGEIMGVSFTPKKWFFFNIEFSAGAEKNVALNLDLRF